MSEAFDIESTARLFIEESLELLEDMEASLLQIEEGSATVEENIDAIFRAAHTIKGSAGIFGYQEIISYTHTLESVLDRIRASQLAMDENLIALFLDAQGHLLSLIEALTSSTSADENRTEEIAAQLKRYLNDSEQDQEQAVGEKETQDSVDLAEEPDSAKGLWRLSIDYAEDVFKSGDDPTHHIRYLQGLGSVYDVQFSFHFPKEGFDAENCYLSLSLSLETEENEDNILEVFEFLDERTKINLTSVKALNKQLVSTISKDQKPENTPQKAPGLVVTETKTMASSKENVIEKESEKSPAAVAKVREIQHLKIDAQKLDHLINLIGELVIASASTELKIDAHQEALMESFGQVQNLVEQIRDGVLNLRMVRVEELFNRQKRTVRDVSKNLGKEVSLVIEGADTELDKTMIDKLNDPLLHILRNSLDHGLESPQEREAKGKPKKGQLALKAYHESGTIVIEVQDDGAGLNTERIRQKAIEKGVISADKSISDEEIHNLIFAPGFSIAKEVTNISGRGVGMDVVRRNIESLRGHVYVTSHVDQGTTIKIRLPLTLSIIEGFHFRIGDTNFIVPENLIQECIEKPEQISNDTKHYINLRGQTIPYVNLRDLLKLPPATRPLRENIVIANFADQTVGLLVDELLGELQAVIKPIGVLFQSVKGISGTSVLGTGELALILDVGQIVDMIEHRL